MEPAAIVGSGLKWLKKIQKKSGTFCRDRSFLYNDAAAYIFAWLIGYGALLGPIAGIMIVDYFFIRKRELSVDDLYRRTLAVLDRESALGRPVDARNPL